MNINGKMTDIHVECPHCNSKQVVVGDKKAKLIAINNYYNHTCSECGKQFKLKIIINPTGVVYFVDNEGHTKVKGVKIYD